MPTKGDEVGPRIDFPGLTYAPINEQGVVLLFGMLADNIGFSVESIRVHYPDAIVIDYRAGKESRGVRKYVEFEYLSSNFEGHDPKEPFVAKNDVATIMIGRGTVTLAVRINPERFSDPANLTRPVKGFFYPRGTEKRIKVTPENFDTVVKIAKSAYQGLD